MGIPEPNTRYSYAEYHSWDDGERWELIDGVAWNMTPAPTTRHQTLALNFSVVVTPKLRGGPCRAFVAPTDVVLSDHDVVQPDFFVVCDPTKVTEACVRGAPDLVAEVLSPSTAVKDRREKKRAYETYGVRELIFIDPWEGYVERFWLGSDGRYGAGAVFGPNEVLPLRSIEGISVPLWEVFETEPPAEDTSGR